MSICDIYGNTLATLHGIDGNVLDAVCDVHGNVIWSNDGIKRTLKGVSNYPDPFGFRIGDEYVETFVAKDGYTLEGAKVSVVMDGEDVTDAVYTMGAVVIDNVSEDLSISIEAVKIDYAIPPASDFTLQLYQGKQAIKAYNGTETAIEMPVRLEVDGVTYETSWYNPTFPDTIEHLKVPTIPHTTGAAFSVNIPAGLKTFWGDGTYCVQTTSAAERIFSPDQKGATKIYVQHGNAKIATARQVEYAKSATGVTGLFYNNAALVDAGTIPSWFTNLDMAFNGCISLERVSIDAKNVNRHGNWISNVPADCKVKLHPDSGTFAYMRGEAVGGSGAGYAQPVLRLYPYDDSEEIHTILCIGDSLTRGIGCDNVATEAYPVKLLEKLSSNTIVYNEGMGSTKAEWHRDKLLNEANKPYLNDALVILWTGTNGNNSSDYTVETLETLIEEMISAMGDNTKFLLIPAVAAALGTGETATHIAHKQWCIDKYGADHVFDVYEWFTSLGLTREDYMADNLHYVAEGYSTIADGIYEKLNANGWVTPA